MPKTSDPRGYLLALLRATSASKSKKDPIIVLFFLDLLQAVPSYFLMKTTSYASVYAISMEWTPRFSAGTLVAQNITMSFLIWVFKEEVKVTLVQNTWHLIQTSCIDPVY